ncbi:MAG: DinB family protein [Kineosporiaceae bacterium]|nr:DinB family protein [Kineosporiaceae bacterium]MBK7623114.1 DinB family protein [Kineosporiaceae bacterium]MBK8074935.1 DinB family protein [Kineosporiaceae bacterium]
MEHAADDIPPDTKDWTWVLDQPCPECGFLADSYLIADLAPATRRTVAAWQEVFARPDLRQRPQPQVWSPLEYACHIRDVYGLFAERITLMLDQDNPQFANWDQDATAVAERYGEQEPTRVFEQLTDAGYALADLVDAVPRRRPNAWLRPGRRSNGSTFTVESITRYMLHDVVHHLHDVGRPLD